MATNHRNLAAWEAAISLATEVYEATVGLPSDEPFGLSHQLRRAAVAIPTLIADGAARNRPGQFIEALRSARICLAELETQLVIAQRRCLVVHSASLLEATARLDGMLCALIRRVSELRSTVPPIAVSPPTAHR